VLAAIWINHQTIFERIVHADQRMLLLNTLHLMFIAFLPFPTAVLSEALHEGTNQPLATAFYGATLAVIGVLVTLMWAYAAHGHRLLSARISSVEAKRKTRTLMVGPVFYALGSALALFAPSLAWACFLALKPSTSRHQGQATRRCRDEALAITDRYSLVDTKTAVPEDRH
jgi:uncharacterized membrane protein